MLGGKYRISESLGQFAAVELASAVDTTNGRAVAIESLPLTAAIPDAAQHARERVLRYRKPHHANLLELRESFEYAGALHVVTEAPSGESLAARLTREAISVSQLSTWLADAMRAVSALHRQGLVLHSVCPGTIFLTSAAPAAPITIKVQPLLLAGLCTQPVSDALLGYCSMEQLAGATDLDASTDVYAFAAIAYQAFTGRLPFEADSPSATRLRIMTESATPLKRARPDLPDELCTLIDLGLAKRREQRLGNLEGMLALLEPCTDQFSRRKVPLLTVQLAAERAPVTPYVQSRSMPQPMSGPAGESSLQPVDKPVTRALPQPSTAGTTARRMLDARKAPLALGALAVAVIAGWLLSQQRSEASPLATDTLPVPTHTAAQPPNTGAGLGVPALADEPDTHAQLEAASLSAPPASETGASTVTDAPAVAAKSAVLTASKAAPAARRSATKRAARAETADPAQTTRPDCNPNYVFDAQGEKHWKPQCF